ncbi:hypothetical protein G3M48_003500, partial [Beauveria asiatica]
TTSFSGLCFFFSNFTTGLYNSFQHFCTTVYSRPLNTMFKHFRRGGGRLKLPIDEPALAPASRKQKKCLRNVKRLSVLVVAVTIMATGFM